jgi:hypothetical protein
MVSYRRNRICIAAEFIGANRLRSQPCADQWRGSTRSDLDQAHPSPSQIRTSPLFNVDATICAMDDTCPHARRLAGIGKTQRHHGDLSRARDEIRCNHRMFSDTSDFGVASYNPVPWVRKKISRSRYNLPVRRFAEAIDQNPSRINIRRKRIQETNHAEATAGILARSCERKMEMLGLGLLGHFSSICIRIRRMLRPRRSDQEPLPRPTPLASTIHSSSVNDQLQCRRCGESRKFQSACRDGQVEHFPGHPSPSTSRCKFRFR